MQCVILIWDTLSNIQLFCDAAGFAKVFENEAEADKYIKKYDISFNYQIVILKGA